FLHLTARRVGELIPPLPAWPEDAAPSIRHVGALRVGDRIFQTWQEAEEREVTCGELRLGELLSRPRSTPFAFTGGRRTEPLLDAARGVVGVLTREQQDLTGTVELEATQTPEGLFQMTLRVVNRTPLGGPATASRDEVSLRALVSTHAILGVTGG